MKRTLLLSLLLLARPAWSASWYVDNAATGAANGTSWANAWTSLPAVVWGASGVQAGDTLYISGGSSGKTYSATGNFPISVGAAGTSDGNRITIKVGQDSGHTGLVTVDNGGTYIGLISVSQNYVTIDGEVSGQIKLKLYNNNVSGQYGCIDSGGAVGLIVRYVEIEKSSLGIAATAGSGGTFERNYLHDIRGDAAIRLNSRNGTTAGFDQTFVQNNVIQLNSLMDGSGDGPDGVQGCYGLTVRSNSFYNASGSLSIPNHADFVQMQAQYVKIYANSFTNITDSALDCDGQTAGVSGNILIYNNVFSMTWTSGIPSGIRIYSTSGAVTTFTNIHILNNTFVDQALATTGGYTIGWGFGTGGNPVVTNVSIKNNIFFNCGKAAARSVINIPASTSAVAADWGIDYNLVNAGTLGDTDFTVDGSSGYTQSNPRTGTPIFESYTMGSAGNDLHLDTSDTAATGQGVDLSAFITTDKDGVTRAAPWDIGAYKATGSSPPASATTLRVGTLILR